MAASDEGCHGAASSINGHIVAHHDDVEEGSGNAEATLLVNAECDPRNDHCDQTKDLHCDPGVYKCRYKTTVTTTTATSTSTSISTTSKTTSTTTDTATSTTTKFSWFKAATTAPATTTHGDVGHGEAAGGQNDKGSGDHNGQGDENSDSRELSGDGGHNGEDSGNSNGQGDANSETYDHPSLHACYTDDFLGNLIRGGEASDDNCKLFIASFRSVIAILSLKSMQWSSILACSIYYLLLPCPS